jgi:hypothetical protein
MPATVSPQSSVRQVTTGAAETLGPGRTVTWNAVAASAYDVIALDDAVLGRLEADSVTLHAALAAPLGPVAVPDVTATGWQAFGAALSSTAAPAGSSVARWARWVSDGTAFGNVQAPAVAAAASTACTVSGLLWCASAYTVRCGAACFSSSGTNLGDFVTSVSIAAGTVTPFAVSVTTPASTALALPEVQVAAPASGDVVYVTALTAWAGAVSVDVTGPLITTASGDFPVDVDLDGERVTVTACSGSSSPQALTVARGTGGIAVAHAAGAPLALWTPPVLSPS